MHFSKNFLHLASIPTKRTRLQLDSAVAVSWVFVLALVVRLAYVLAEQKLDLVRGGFLSGDGYLYDDLAQNLLKGKGYSTWGSPTALVVPGYPLFLAACYALFGRDLLAVAVVQCALSSLSCALVWLIARRIFDARVAWVAALWCIFLPEMVMWTSGQILTEPVYTFWLVLAVFCLMHAPFSEVLTPARTTPGQKNSARLSAMPFFAAGMALSLASITRPVALGFALCAVIYVARQVDWKRAACVALPIVLVFAGWTLRNTRVMGVPLPTSTDSGWVLYIYHGPSTPATYDGYEPHVTKHEDKKAWDEVRRHSWYQRAALRHALQNPQHELVLSARRFWNLWRPTYASSSLRNRIISFATYVPFILLATVGLLSLRFRDGQVGLLTLFVLYHLAFHTLIASELRFRLPLEPILAIFAAFAAVNIWSAFFPFREATDAASSETRRDSALATTATLRVSVIVPAYNEARHIENVLRRIAAVPIDKEVIVVNDASTDNMAEVLDAVPELYDKRCDLPHNGGKGTAVLAGLEQATGDVVLVQDADGELDPADYPALLEPLAANRAQVVFGSRFMAGGPHLKRLPVTWTCRTANRGLTGITNLLFGSRLTDMETGFKVCRLPIMRALQLHPSRYELEPEITAKLLKSKVVIHEVPVSYLPRPRNEKIIGVRDGLLALKVLLRIRCTRFSLPNSATTATPQCDATAETTAEEFTT